MISEITDAETESIIRNLTGMKMLTTEQETDRYFQEVRTMLQKRKPEYEELMSILEEGEQVWMYVREKNPMHIHFFITYLFYISVYPFHFVHILFQQLLSSVHLRRYKIQSLPDFGQCLFGSLTSILLRIPYIDQYLAYPYQ